MDTSPVAPAVTYVADVGAVVAAGHRLELALGDAPPVQRAAARRLEEALESQSTGADALGSLMFAPPRAGAARPGGPVGPEDALGAVLLEVQVANVSLAAGGAIGEAGPAQGVSAYEDALQDLRATTRELSAVIAAEHGAVAPEGQLGFRVRLRGDAAAIGSATPAEARANLSATVDRTTGAIVDDSREVAAAIWTEARKLPGSKLLGDVVAVARDFGLPVETAGRLIALGIAKLKAALAALQRVFGLGGVDEVTPYLDGLWDKLEARDPLRQALMGIYGGPDTLRLRDELLALDRPALAFDTTTSAIGMLADRFAQTMRLARKLLRALAVASGVVGALVAFLPGVNLHHLAITAAGYLLLCAGVVLSGMDHMDATPIGRVVGVRTLLEELTA